MEILNQLLSNRVDYLNALRHSQQMPVTPQPDPGNGPKFNLNGKLIIRVLTAVGILYVGYQIYKSLISEPLEEEE